MLDFTCPFCKKEIQDTDDVLMSNADDINRFDLEDTPKVFFHSNCLKEDFKNKKK